MKKFLKISCATVLLTAVSCTNLDEDLKRFTNAAPIQNQGFGVPTNVNKPVPVDGLNAAFSSIRNGIAWHGSYFTVNELSSDEAVITQKGGDWFDGGVNLVLHTHTWTSTNDHINNAWNDLYNAVYQCNTLLADATITDLNKKAQLRTLRAYFYWRLMDMYGRIKLVTSPGVDVAQGTRVQAYNFIESELLAAIPNLTAARQDYGRVSLYGAHALLARLYLNSYIYKGIANNSAEYLSDLDKAITSANVVINSGVYDLSDDYAKIFSPDNVDNIEHILVAPFDQATGGGMNFAQMTLHYPSQLTFRLQQQPWNGYSTLEEFYNSYEATDERRANNFIAGPQTDVNGNPIVDVAFDAADDDGAPINYTPKINELAPNGSRQAGARLGKFSFKLFQGNDMDNDFPILRYTEVLLNKAEALCRKNGYADATANTIITEIRARAGVGPLTGLDATKLLQERGRELFQEALRRTDLIRFGKFNDAWWEKSANPDTKLLIFPIPQKAIQASSGIGALTQNPGY